MVTQEEHVTHVKGIDYSYRKTNLVSILRHEKKRHICHKSSADSPTSVKELEVSQFQTTHSYRPLEKASMNDLWRSLTSFLEEAVLNEQDVPETTTLYKEIEDIPCQP